MGSYGYYPLRKTELSSWNFQRPNLEIETRTDDAPAGQASMIVAMEVGDYELLRRAIRGDEDAFTAIYRRHEGSIYRFALRMSGSEAVAEEVTQEVFLFLIRRPERYCPEKGTLGAFLIGVARNLAMKHRGRSGRETALSDVRIAAPGAGLPEAIERNDEIEFVQRESQRCLA